MLKKFLKSVAPTALLALSLVAMSSSASAKEVNDNWITMKTKMSLLTATGLDGTQVNVDTIRGRITLHGRIESAAQEQRAIEIARGIEGVTDVRSLLQIVREPHREAVRASDKAILRNVRAALRADPSLADSSIRVQSVSKGVVLLNGSADSLSDHRRALQIARSSAGVVAVASEIQSPNQLADREIWLDRDAPATSTTAANAHAKAHEKTKAKGTQKSSSPVSDMWITSAVKLRLLGNSDTPASDINVDTTEGVVTLFGIVPTEQSKVAAGKEAELVTDVRRVVNALQVVAAERRDVVERRDDDVDSAVTKALADNPELENSDIDVEVKNGVVRLTGEVAQPGDRFEAALTARLVDGVRSVREELTVESKASATR